MTYIMQDTPNHPKVALVAYEGAQMAALYGLADLFDVASRMGATPAKRKIAHEVLSTPLAENDTVYDAVVLPPNLVGARGVNDRALHSWIARQHRHGAVACSACAGAFWLAQAGILDGRAATTHWALEGEFNAAFPKVQLHPEHILLDDHDIVTAGGVMAWVDLGLHLVRRWLGSDAVSRTCRHMLIDPTGREQRNYRAFRPNLGHKDRAIRDLQLWMEGHVDADLSLNALAARAGMSPRSLQRKFAGATGYSPSQYIQELRVEKAKALLEQTSRPVSEICYNVGYQDLAAFSRLFKANSGLSAGEYRRRFQIT